eukprot:2251387-Rhodomonas_salina.3
MSTPGTAVRHSQYRAFRSECVGHSPRTRVGYQWTFPEQKPSSAKSNARNRCRGTICTEIVKNAFDFGSWYLAVEAAREDKVSACWVSLAFSWYQYTQPQYFHTQSSVPAYPGSVPAYSLRLSTSIPQLCVHR